MFLYKSSIYITIDVEVLSVMFVASLNFPGFMWFMHNKRSLFKYKLLPLLIAVFTCGLGENGRVCRVWNSWHVGTAHNNVNVWLSFRFKHLPSISFLRVLIIRYKTVTGLRYLLRCADCIDSVDTFCYPSLPAIALGKSARWYTFSAQSWWMLIFTDRITLYSSYVGVNRRMSLVTSYFLLQLLSTCFGLIYWIVYEVGLNFFSCRALLSRFVQNSTQHSCVVAYSSTYSTIARKNYCFILLEISDCKTAINLTIAVYAILMHMLTYLSVDEIFF